MSQNVCFYHHIVKQTGKTGEYNNANYPHDDDKAAKERKRESAVETIHPDDTGKKYQYYSEDNYAGADKDSAFMGIGDIYFRSFAAAISHISLL
jgi:hypothetical protein